MVLHRIQINKTKHLKTRKINKLSTSTDYRTDKNCKNVHHPETRKKIPVTDTLLKLKFIRIMYDDSTATDSQSLDCK